MVNFKQLRNGNYFAGSDGEIYSNFKGTYRVLKKAVQSTGCYYAVSVRFGDIRKTHRVHRLICEAFNGVAEFEKAQCSHIDGNWKNNLPENLLWETAKINLSRKLEHGTDDTGYKNSRAKINKEQLEEIKHLLHMGTLTQQRIGELFGVSRIFITKIKNGHRYKMRESHE